MKSLIRLLVFLLSLSGRGTGHALAEDQTTILYVLSKDGTEPCPTHNVSRCLTLNDYIDRAESYFHSDTIFMFMTSGSHSLHGIAEFHNLSNVSLKRYISHVRQQENPRVVCDLSQESGLLFVKVTQLQIESLSFFNCGHSVIANDISSAAIALFHIINLSMTYYVEVSHSSGCGLYIFNSFGLTNISYSKFTYNIRGGNLALNYSNCSLQTTNTGSLVSILSSFFGHGSAEKGKILSPGIIAFIWCTNVSLEFTLSFCFQCILCAHIHFFLGGDLHLNSLTVRY